MDRFLLLDGKLTAAARHPNVGEFRIETAAEDRRSGFQFTPENLPSNFDPLQGVCDLVFLHDWSSSRLPVASIDWENHFLQTVGPIGCSAPHYAIDHFEKHPRYWLEGHSAFADRSGEWFLDTVKQELVVFAGPESAPPQVEWPLIETLLTATGSAERPLSQLQLEGIVFSGTKFSLPAGGLAGAQATMHEPRGSDGLRNTRHRPMLSAAVMLEQASRCQVVACRFQSLGNSGLWLGSRTADCEILDSKFDDIGGNAINLGEDSQRQIEGQVWYQAAPDQIPTRNRVSGCKIRRCGRVLPGSVAIWAALQRRLEIAENVIEDCPYTGISLGWIWDDRRTPAGQNDVHHNQIRYVMQVLSDGGGIYTLGRQPDSRLRENSISDVPLNAGRAESNGMFLDQGSAGFTISDNHFRRIAKSPLRFHRAGKNTVQENRWELKTEATPPVRYNATPTENIVVGENTVLPRELRTYLIGNSLTWDARPPLLEGHVRWHVDCGKSLQFIHDYPTKPCVGSSRLWPDELSHLQYDYLVLQPHYGTQLEQDVAVISKWLELQPNATIVIHNGWAHSVSAAEEYDTEATTQMVHSPAYFARLLATLKSMHPDRTFRQTHSTEMLHRIGVDISAGPAPLQNLTDLYRDAIHMTHQEGRYLMHNLMRIALDQPPSATGFTLAQEQPELKAYLDRYLISPAKQPADAQQDALKP